MAEYGPWQMVFVDKVAKAIEVMLEALENGGRYEPPARPDSPDRSGMGITEDDK